MIGKDLKLKKKKKNKKKRLKIAVCSCYPLLEPDSACENNLNATDTHSGSSLTASLRRKPESGFISDITDAAHQEGEGGVSLHTRRSAAEAPCPRLTSLLSKTAAESASS